MDCACHGEPMYWHSFPSRACRGYWRCAVAKRGAHQAHRAQKLERQRDRYDSDPVYRIEKNLHDRARGRAETLKRKREAIRGEVSL